MLKPSIHALIEASRLLPMTFALRHKCSTRIFYYRRQTVPNKIPAASVKYIRQLRKRGWTYADISYHTGHAISTAWGWSRNVRNH